MLFLLTLPGHTSPPEQLLRPDSCPPFAQAFPAARIPFLRITLLPIVDSTPVPSPSLPTPWPLLPTGWKFITPPQLLTLLGPPAPRTFVLTAALRTWHISNMRLCFDNVLGPWGGSSLVLNGPCRSVVGGVLSSGGWLGAGKKKAARRLRG